MRQAVVAQHRTVASFRRKTPGQYKAASSDQLPRRLGANANSHSRRPMMPLELSELTGHAMPQLPRIVFQELKFKSPKFEVSLGSLRLCHKLIQVSCGTNHFRSSILKKICGGPRPCNSSQARELGGGCWTWIWSWGTLAFVNFHAAALSQ